MHLAPLILTAKLDATSFRRLDEMRRAHFPPERNLLAAHVTLFHKLPGEELSSITEDLERECAKRSPMHVSFPSLRFLGRGVAVEIESAGLVRLRGEFARVWAAHLGPQDSQKFRPHVTIQNKVEPATARELFEELSTSFELADGRITGLELWHYEGGPWRLEREFAFDSTLDDYDAALGI